MSKKSMCSKIVKSAAAASLLFLIVVLSAMPVSAKTKPTRWKVTQYGNGNAAHQSMFYTIKSNTGKLVVIDGGWSSDVGNVRNVIAQEGNRVHAWIITHPHPDHVGALNEILRHNTTGIRIDKIYTTKVSRKRYKATAASWDDIDTYETFYQLTKNSRKLVYLKEGDTIDLIGLKMTVFNAWDKTVNSLTKNLCNYGSLMFKVEGKKRSMLFCGDVGKLRQKRILKRHKKELASTYVQCGHHGNWGLNSKFYKYVSPKAAFFDAPRIITEDTSGTYTAPNLIRYFKNAGARVYTFANGNGTHSVTLK